LARPIFLTLQRLVGTGRCPVGKELNRIDKRAIEALAMAPLIKALAERIGLEEALSILGQVNEKEAYERGRSMAEAGGRNDIQALVEEVATWGRGGIWEMEVLERTERTYFFDVLKCPYHQKYKDLGLVELGVQLSCCRDEPFARGFNPRLKLVRTKTIMEGADRCDFRYRLKDE
jgi:hypothetical protein